ncbi:MAG: trehalose-6-phosphate synthase [Bacteroidota bacterium]|nr:trehalose-6-phosphate synthase [Bacteroidota bacterium]
MKISIRLILSLLFVAILVAGLFSYIQVRDARESLIDDLNRRSLLVAESLKESIVNLLPPNYKTKLNQLLEKFGNKERLFGVAVYDSQGVVLSATPGLFTKVPENVPQIFKSIQENQTADVIGTYQQKDIHIFSFPIRQNDKNSGAIVIYHDISYIKTRLDGIWENNFIRLLTLSLLIILTTVLVVRWSIVGPIAKLAEWLKNLRMGKSSKQIELPEGDILGPLASEITHLAKSLAMARAKAEEEARLRIIGETTWTAERLKEHVRIELGEKNLYLVSNREPYMHIKKGRKIEYIIPAGGLVTALDPVMRACGGVWIAHGSGDADFETADQNGKIKVPPDEPIYTLKRVWLSKEEEQGYYYGFSNEGIWPLCHITHTRPDFHLEDWIYYQKVNEKFAEAVLEEIKSETDPLILIQDYHFALVSFMVKSKRPDARVAIFWHIPWPNPEAFGICPWQKEILVGLLGADIIGFHIQYHCNNFLETVDRVLESKINWEQFTIERGGQITQVKPFPISVAFPSLLQNEMQDEVSKKKIKKEILEELGIEAELIGVGVDRIDYTKGIVERLKAIDRFFEKYPKFVGKFTFVELGAPSRTHIKRYQDLISEVETVTDKICWKYQAKNWKPIVFLKAHHSHEEINRYYQVADVCLVTSLHDGMNLVAKEFIASRNDEDGVLILSQFTGASRELQDALIVNPYDIEEMVDALEKALEMQQEERKERMQRLRNMIKERNVYRWAGNLVSALNRVRISKTVS